MLYVFASMYKCMLVFKKVAKYHIFLTRWNTADIWRGKISWKKFEINVELTCNADELKKYETCPLLLSSAFMYLRVYNIYFVLIISMTFPFSREVYTQYNIEYSTLYTIVNGGIMSPKVYCVWMLRVRSNGHNLPNSFYNVFLFFKTRIVSSIVSRKKPST